MTSKTDDNFFPSIRDAAEKTDLLSDDPVDGDKQTDDEDRAVQEIESLCMSCGEQGSTRMLLTTIPYFKEVIIMSFRCEHCGASNNEVQSAGAYRDQGIVYTAKILDREDLDRQLVKSNTCTITIPEFELTIPAGRGQLTTVEGLLRDTVRDLSADQPLRRIQDAATWEKLQAVIDLLAEIIGDSDDDDDDDEDATEEAKQAKRHAKREAILIKPIRPFTLKLDDPTGNSFVEFVGSMADPKWNMREYNRTREQNVALGLASEVDEDAAITEKLSTASIAEADEDDIPLTAGEEIFVFPGVCSSCGHALDTMMKKVVIPYFKDIIIMSTNCTICGYRDNEVKSGGEISKQGRKITLKVEDAEDLSRDILKSETCKFEIPEIDLVLQSGTLGGRFTTLEGILNQVYEELNEKVFMGDSKDKNAPGADDHRTFAKFLGNLKQVIAAEIPFTVILDDPLANSYLQNLYAPDPDPAMIVEAYDRTFDQNDDLGLNDINVEGYEEGHRLELEANLKGEAKDSEKGL